MGAAIRILPGKVLPCTAGVAIMKRKKKLGVSNTPYDGGRWVTDGGWWVTDGGWCVTDGGWWVTDGGWCVTDGGWCVTDGGWWVTDGGWWVATKHQRVAALVKKKKKAERPYGNPWCTAHQTAGCISELRTVTRVTSGLALGAWMSLCLRQEMLTGLGQRVLVRCRIIRVGGHPTTRDPRTIDNEKRIFRDAINRWQWC